MKTPSSPNYTYKGFRCSAAALGNIAAGANASRKNVLYLQCDLLESSYIAETIWWKLSFEK